MGKTLELLRKSGALDRHPERTPKRRVIRDAQGKKQIVPKIPPRYFNLSKEEKRCWQELIKQFGELPSSYTTQVALAARLQHKINTSPTIRTTDVNQLNSIINQLNRVANYGFGDDETFD